MTQNEHSATPYDRRDKWLSTVIWITLFVGLLLSSYVVLSTVMSDGAIALFSLKVSRAYGISEALGGTPEVSALVIINSLFGIGVAVLLAFAWLKFVVLSRVLIVSYAWLEEQAETSTIFSDLLIDSTAPRGSDEPTDQAGVEYIDKTRTSEVVRFLAYAWIVMLGMHPVSVILAALFG